MAPQPMTAAACRWLKPNPLRRRAEIQIGCAGFNPEGGALRTVRVLTTGSEPQGGSRSRCVVAALGSSWRRASAFPWHYGRACSAWGKLFLATEIE